jgi:hypothetical protein
VNPLNCHSERITSNGCPELYGRRRRIKSDLLYRLVLFPSFSWIAATERRRD